VTMSVVVTMMVTVVVVDVGVTGDSLIEDLSLESSLGVNNIVYGTEDAIGLDETVVTLGNGSIADLRSALDITGVLIGDPVTVLVSRISMDVIMMTVMVAMSTMVAMSMPSELGGSNGDKGQNSDE